MGRPEHQPFFQQFLPQILLERALLGGVYQFEREILLERQKIGIEKAQREGKFKGRVPTAKRKTDEIKTLIAEGLKPHQIAAQLNIGVASVYRYREHPSPRRLG